MSRRLAREIAFQTLFQRDLGRNETEPALSLLAAESGLGGEYVDFARELVEGAVREQETIDRAISRYLQRWELNRLAAVDRALLRLAAYELFFFPDIPAAVAINEALELCKRYHSEESAKFLNGVLDKIARERSGNGGVS
ncbi:MAG TPA: transcription antitermination factor NusB [Firmicutes bacterium]|nr:transcription antitermination factor NusB [Bacillota bacterium]